MNQMQLHQVDGNVQPVSCLTRPRPLHGGAVDDHQAQVALD
jgi:hypothetical protein